MTAPQKIALHLLSNRWNSAITEYALSAANALRLEGWDCVVTPLLGSPAELRAVAMGFAVKPLMRFSAGALFDVKKIFEELKPYLVITYGGPENLLARVARSTLPGVKIIRFRGHEIPEGQIFFKERHRLSHTHCNMIITPSESLTNSLLGSSACPVETIPLGVDDLKYRCKDFSIKRSRDIIILGRLDPVKGHQVFLRRFRELLKSWSEPTWRPRLHIIGEPANLSVLQIEKYVLDLGLEMGSEVLITSSRVENIAELMASAVAGIIPSLGSEIICRVAEEFLLSGAPLAVSGVGTLNELLIHPEFGISWSSLNDAETVQALEEMFKMAFLESPSDRKKRSDLAFEHFSYGVMGASLSGVLGEI